MNFVLNLTILVVRQEDSAYLICMQACFVLSGFMQTQFKGVVAHPLARTIIN
jgi:hypothetical protein